jgi:hypothetical protein
LASTIARNSDSPPSSGSASAVAVSNDLLLVSYAKTLLMLLCDEPP